MAVWAGWLAVGCVDADALCEQLEDRAMDCEVSFDRPECAQQLLECTNNEELMIGAYLNCVGDSASVRDFDCGRPQSGEEQQVALERFLSCASNIDGLSPACRAGFNAAASLQRTETTTLE